MLMEECIEQNPKLFEKKYGDILLPTRMVDKGEKLTVRVEVFESDNAAFAITHNCFSPEAMTESIPLHLRPENGIFVDEIEIEFSQAGNTRLELWCGSKEVHGHYANGKPAISYRDGGRILRQVAVLEEGYTAIIPWIGTNFPVVDTELHKHDLPGDYWMNIDLSDQWEEDQVQNLAKIVQGVHRYGDRVAVMVSANDLAPGFEGSSVFELSREEQTKGFAELCRLLRKMGIDTPELFACYTPDGVTIDILEKMGIKGLTSLCVWQNWKDGGENGWKINHTGAPNQPYFPAADDFRKNGEKRKLMCFSMGNASCNRNYGIMAYDGCPSNASMGQRYLENRVEHFHIQRFYDALDAFLLSAKNNKELTTLTVAIESFRGFADWNAINEIALRYIVRKAAKEKIVFVSAADVSDYHRRKDLPMQKTFFFQPDTYFGLGMESMPGHIPDRIEADHPEYLAVIKRGSLRPMFFFDYSEDWASENFIESGRNQFGLTNPDVVDPSEWQPKQVETRDVRFSQKWEGDTLVLSADCDTPKKRMVTGVFDLPFTGTVTFRVDKEDAVVTKISDSRGRNLHLFIDMGTLQAGKNEIRIQILGIRCQPEQYVFEFGQMGTMKFHDHFYLRSLDRERGISVRMKAPEGASLLFNDGTRKSPENGVFSFTVNTDWFDEGPILYGMTEQQLQAAEISTEDAGETKSLREIPG